jgi:hypothetical protein
MAPEQIEGAHQVDHRADIYSLGVVFYEMLTGQLPIGRFPPPSRKVEVDVRLDDVVLRSLEHEPERRYQHASEIKTDVEVIAVDAGHQESAGKPTGIEPENAEQFVLSQLPTTRVDAVKAYQEKTGAGRTEAALAIDAIVRKHRVTFTPLPQKRLLRHIVRETAIMGVLIVLYVLFRRYIELSSTLGWSIVGLVVVCIYIFFSVAAWRSRSIDRGLQFRFFAGFFLFLILVNPLLVILAEPMIILKRLYGLTGATPGLHDVLVFRIIVGAISVGGLYWLWRLWRQFRAHRKAAIGLEFAKSRNGQATRTEGTPGEATEVARQRLRIPAIGLIVIGMIDCLMLVVPGFAHGFAAVLGSDFGILGSAVSAVSFGTGLLVVAGAIAMIKLRSYRLAVAGSIFAMLPNSPACFMGIWAIIVLSRAEVRTAFAAKKSQLAASGRQGNPASVIAIIGIVIIVLALLVSAVLMLAMIPGGPFYDRRAPVTRSGTSGPGSETTPMKIGGMDMPFGAWDYVEYGPAGPALTDECAETLDLKPSELLAVNEIIQGAYREYLELEAARTDRQRVGDSLKVTITPFREQALAILERLWADLDSILDTRKRAIARRHLPLGRAFSVSELEFGGPAVTLTVKKEGRAYNYEIKRDWPEDSGMSDGGRSGRHLTLPPEYQRFWDVATSDEQSTFSQFPHQLE